MDPRIQKALTASLLTLSDKPVLSRLKITGFLPGDDTDYDTIRRSMDRNGDFFK